jgi:hypothetical protein
VVWIPVDDGSTGNAVAYEPVNHRREMKSNED